MLSESSGSRHLAAGSDRISAGNSLKISRSWSACCCWRWARGCGWCGEWGSCPERGSRAGSATRCPWWRVDCFLQVSDLFLALCCGTSLSVRANFKRRLRVGWNRGWRASPGPGLRQTLQQLGRRSRGSLCIISQSHGPQQSLAPDGGWGSIELRVPCAIRS